MKRKNTRAIDIPTDVIDLLLRAGLKWNAYKKEITKSAVRYSEIEMFARRSPITRDYLQQWGGICIFPYCGFLEGFFSGKVHHMKPGVFSATLSRNLPLMDGYWANMLWSLTSRIYVLAPALERYVRALADIEKTEMPVGVFQNLPDRCVFISTPDTFIGHKNILGFFAYNDFHPDVGPMLVLSFVTPALKIGLIVRLALKEGAFEDNIVNKSIVKTVWNKCFENDSATQTVFDRFADEADSDVQILALNFALPRLLCVCAQNLELYDLKMKREVKRLLLKSEKDLTGSCNFNAHAHPVSILCVGDNINVSADSQLYFDVSENDATCELLDWAEQNGAGEELRQVASEAPAEPAASLDADKTTDATNSAAVTALKKKLDEAKDQAKTASWKLDEANAEIKRLTIRFKSCEEKLQKTEEERKELSGQLEKLNRELADTADKYQKQQQEIDDVLKDNDALSQQNKDLVKQNETLAASVEPQKKRIESLNEIAQDLRKANEKLSADVRKYSDESKRYLDMYLGATVSPGDDAGKLAQLETELKSAKKELSDAHQQISLLSTENAKITHAAKTSTSGSTPAELHLDNGVLRKVFFGETLSATDCLKFVETLYGTKVTVLPSAWESAEKIDTSFKQTKELAKTLFMLVNDYLPKYLDGGDNKARGVFGTKYSASESDGLQMSSKLMKDRVFSGIVMVKHLRIGYRERLYFEVDNATRKVLIGYCGTHLTILSA